MIGLDDFRDRMKAEVEKTKKNKVVQVSGRSLDDALKQASLELALPLRVLEYEILEKGRSKFFGYKGTPWKIVAYESTKESAKRQGRNLDEEFDIQSYTATEAMAAADADGRFSVRLGSDGVWVKVFPAVGKGVPVIEGDVVGQLHNRYITELDMDNIETAVQRADTMWIKVGTFAYNPANDALLSLEVTDEEMRAYINVQKPGIGGADVTVDDIKGILSNNSIIFGILEDALQEFEDFPQYHVPFLVAEGIPPINGSDAHVLYNFETEPDKIHIQEREDGSVDFKELNRYQNVVKGQQLARKIAPETGKDGRTIYGKYIPAKDGNDLEIGLGKNVTIVENGTVVEATSNGHVMLKKGKITVETVLVIPSNIDSRTGNVNALGSVEIRGNVEDGFSVTAQGNIEVAGYVGKANLKAAGDIIVSRGINGGEGDEFGHIIAEKSIWSSFIQNAQVVAGEFVVVSAGIVNSNVMSQRKVLCRGRRARIVGGQVRASEEVNAVILGSGGGLETIVEVGFDPKIKEEIKQLVERRDALEAEINTIGLNLQGLKRQIRKQGRQFSQGKQGIIKELRIKRNELQEEIIVIDNEIQQKQENLESQDLHAKVSASHKVLAGVTLRIRDAEYMVKDSYENSVTFILEDGYIRTVKYHAIEEDLTRK